MLLKAVGQRWTLLKGYNKPLGNPKSHWKASGQLLKDIGKLLGNAQNTSRQPIEEEAELASVYWQKRGNFC
jgi:hypothetical protein